jgi:hypothetical protein
VEGGYLQQEKSFEWSKMIWTSISCVCINIFIFNYNLSEVSVYFKIREIVSDIKRKLKGSKCNFP